VTLGLCSQIELDEIIAKSADKRRKLEEARAEQTDGPGLAPAEEVQPFAGESVEAPEADSDKPLSADDVFKNFTG